MSTTISTIEQAFEKMQIQPGTKPVITGIPEQYVPVLEAVFSSLVVSDAMRDGWKPNYNNKERKWEPWFLADDPSGFRFHVSNFTHAGTLSVLGPLHSQRTEEQSDQFAKLVVPIFRAIHNPKK